MCGATSAKWWMWPGWLVGNRHRGNWHSFVSLLSDARVPIESISRLVGHRSTMVTETIYRKQLRPVIEDGAQVMDRILPAWPPRES